MRLETFALRMPLPTAEETQEARDCCPPKAAPTSSQPRILLERLPKHLMEPGSPQHTDTHAHEHHAKRSQCHSGRLFWSPPIPGEWLFFPLAGDRLMLPSPAALISSHYPDILKCIGCRRTESP